MQTIKAIALATVTGALAGLGVTLLSRQFQCVPGEQLTWSAETGHCYCPADGWKPSGCKPYPEELR